MNETAEELKQYGTKLPLSQIAYLQRFPGGAAKLLRTMIAARMKRENANRKRSKR